MARARVGIIGAGIAGPVLAMLLKLKGYDPVVFERNEGVSEAGLALGLQPNGLRILSQVPGLIDAIPGYEIDEMHWYSALPEDHGVIATLDHPRRAREANPGLGTRIVRRSALTHALVDFARKLGVEVRFGHKLEAIEQDEEKVKAIFANGAQEELDFIVGCDGLHSNTRICLFGEQPADYTGLTQTGGFSPMPERFKGKSIAMNIFGDGAHMIGTPVDAETMMWAITQREPEAKETWRAMDADAVAEFKKSPISQWGFDAGELLKNGEKVTKYGLYDRPELKTWHKGRVILIGDAAHPTSPHLGQGANQAFEDCGLLVSLLAQHNPSAAPPPAAVLEQVFAEFEQARIPKSAEMVKRARAQGETRVVHGTEACIARNKWYRELCSNEDMLKARFSA